VWRAGEDSLVAAEQARKLIVFIGQISLHYEGLAQAFSTQQSAFSGQESGQACVAEVIS